MQLGEIGGARADALRSFCEQASWQAGLGALPFVHGRASTLPSVSRRSTRAADAFLIQPRREPREPHAGPRVRSHVRADLRRAEPSRSCDDAVRARAVHGAPRAGLRRRRSRRSTSTAAESARRFVSSASPRRASRRPCAWASCGPHEAQRLQHELGAARGRGRSRSARAWSLERRRADRRRCSTSSASLHDRLYCAALSVLRFMSDARPRSRP